MLLRLLSAAFLELTITSRSQYLTEQCANGAEKQGDIRLKTKEGAAYEQQC